MANDTVLRIEAEGPVRWITIDAPPMNVMTGQMFAELRTSTSELATDPDVLVVVFQSADPDFFIAHFDVEMILGFDTSTPVEPSRELNAFGLLCETVRTAPFVSIGKIGGRIGGGGAELAAAMDMRFGALGRTSLCQMEVPIGILPGGGGTQRLPGLVGRGRAMEIICGGVDVEAATLDHWGWLNRALPADELDRHVDDLARRIGGFPVQAVRLAKASMDRSAPDPIPGLLLESDNFARLIRTPEARSAMETFLVEGGQTRHGELGMTELLDRVHLRREPDTS